MKAYENPNLELIKVLGTDVIATSVEYGVLTPDSSPDESASLASSTTEVMQ